MNDLKPTIDTLKNKIEQLIAAHSQLAGQLKEAEAAKSVLESRLQEAESANANLQAQQVEPVIDTAQLDALKAENAALQAQLAQQAEQANADKAALESRLADAENAAKQLQDNAVAPVADTTASDILKAEHAALLSQLAEEQAKAAQYADELKQKELLVKELAENNKIHNLAQSITGKNGPEENEGLKLIITDLVKEIDKCIALLGKNV